MVPSPCQQICEIDPDTGWCKGCLRTLDEIAGWGQKPAAERDRIWNELHERKIQQQSGSGQHD